MQCRVTRRQEEEEIKRRQRRKDRDNKTGVWKEEMNPEMRE